MSGRVSEFWKSSLRRAGSVISRKAGCWRDAFRRSAVRLLRGGTLGKLAASIAGLLLFAVGCGDSPSNGCDSGLSGCTGNPTIYNVYAVPTSEGRASTCPGPEYAGVSVPIDTRLACNGLGTAPTGNANSIAILGCSATCICFRQFGGSPDCGVTPGLGTNVKESCTDRCQEDCSSRDCGALGLRGPVRTFLKLSGGAPRCRNFQTDADYSCNTTGMLGRREGGE
jgi:hypothetical protein